MSFDNHMYSHTAKINPLFYYKPLSVYKVLKTICGTICISIDAINTDIIMQYNSHESRHDQLHLIFVNQSGWILGINEQNGTK